MVERIIATVWIASAVFLFSACGPAGPGNSTLPPAILTDYINDTNYPDSDWSVGTPESVGIKPQKLQGLSDYINQMNYEIHGFLIIKNGKKIFERYGKENGFQYTPDVPHDVHSVTKTFTSALLGIAISEGHIPGVHAKVMDYFSNDNVLNKSASKDSMTIEDLLTMRSGLQVDENNDGALFNETNSALAILNRPVINQPGTVWNYLTANSQILSEIIRRATGRTPLQYGIEKLFGPMNIVPGLSNFIWYSDYDGTQFGGFAMIIKPRDMAKLGYLFLKNGVWNGTNLVPANWISNATAPACSTPWAYPQYGYQIWLPRMGGYAAFGYMGQGIFVFPDENMVVVITSALPNSQCMQILENIISSYLF